MARESVSFVGMRIFAGTSDEAIEELTHLVDAGRGGYVTFTGAHGVAETTRSDLVSEAHGSASIVYPDGVPLTWLARRVGLSSEQIAGPRFIGRVLERAESRGWSVFLFGAQTSTLEAFAARTAIDHPALRIVGTESPPFGDPSEWPNAETLARIRESGADLVFVALSTPKQELWMHAVSTLAAPGPAPVLMGLGAAIDVVAGVQRSVPPWVEGSGVEWLYRMAREPRRLWRRYAFSVPTFLWLALRRPARRA